MDLKELFFKVVIANRIDIPMSIGEMRKFATHEMYMAEYDEKIINVMYKPTNNLDESKFSELMKKKLKKRYGTPLVERIEKVKNLE